MKNYSIGAFFLLFLNASIQAETLAPNTAGEMTVYRSPSCSCCGRWLEQMQKSNFKIKDIVTDDVQTIKNQYGITADLASCHTAIINGYAIEGHVPAADIAALLTDKPQVAGVAVPGMVIGSPGMEMGDKHQPYQVVSFDKAHNVKVVKSYP